MTLSNLEIVNLLPGQSPIPPTEAAFAAFTHQVADGLSAHALGGQSGATKITTPIARFSTVASAGDSCILPAALPGLVLYALAPDTALAVTTLGIFVCAKAGLWSAIAT